MNKDSKKPKILLVDDEETVRLSGKYAFESWFDVATVKTTAEALELLKAEQPDLILLDIFIEGEGQEGSLDALKIISKEYPRLPVIILSGTVTWMQRWDELKHLGAVGYLSKPFEISRAREIIERCLKGERMYNVW